MPKPEPKGEIKAPTVLKTKSTKRSEVKKTPKPKVIKIEPPAPRIESKKVPQASVPLKKTPDTLSEEQVKTTLKEYNFFCSDYDRNKTWSNPRGNGIMHNYVQQTLQGDKVVPDKATGLMWQQSGSPNYMTYADAEQYVRDLNNKSFAGFTDWRLPTLEEAMSLMESQKSDALYVNPIFGSTQWWIWMADEYRNAG